MSPSITRPCRNSPVVQRKISGKKNFIDVSSALNQGKQSHAEGED
jgi:hypothetical protein